MFLRIDPMVDCVFKAILGKETNEDVLIHFLNAILGLEGERCVEEAKVLNPYNEKEFVSGKLTVVDIKARDGMGRTFQLEAQCGRSRGRKNRILYSWAQTYDRSIKSGEQYPELKPTIAIWLLDEVLFGETDEVHLQFEIFSREHHITFSNHLAIHVLQLKNLKEDVILRTDRDRWLYLFRYGAGMDLDCLPAALDTPIFNKVVKTMRAFTQEEREQHLYERRLMADGEYRHLQNMAREERQQRLVLQDAFEKERQQRLAAHDAHEKEREQLLAAHEKEQQQRLAAHDAHEKEREQLLAAHEKEQQQRLAMEAQLRRAGIKPEHI